MSPGGQLYLKCSKIGGLSLQRPLQSRLPQSAREREEKGSKENREGEPVAEMWEGFLH